MPELGLVVYLLAISYGMGALWYTLLGRSPARWTRMTAFPLVGVVIWGALPGPSFLACGAWHRLLLQGEIGANRRGGP